MPVCRGRRIFVMCGRGLGRTQLLREIEEMNTPYTRHEGIKPTTKLQLTLPSHSFKYEVRPNSGELENDSLHTIFPHRPFKAIEMSAMTERELLCLREFFNRSIEHALETVRELDHQATVQLAAGKPSKRLYRPDPKLLIFPEGGGIPDEWEPVEESAEQD